MGGKEVARSVAEGAISAAPGVAKWGCLTTGALVVLMVAGGVVGEVGSMIPQMKCIDIPPGMGPVEALQDAGVLNGVDPFPIEVRIPYPNGGREMEIHRADSYDELLPPYGLLDYNFSEVPNEVQTAKGPQQTLVCYDTRPPEPTPISRQPRGRNRHLVGTKPMGRISRVVYSSSGRR